MISDRDDAGWRHHEEPHVVVLVGVLGRRIHDVDVQVDGRLDDPQSVDSRLLDRLPKCHTCQVAVAVGVATRLQPSLQLGVEQNEDAVVRRIHDKGRAGEVAWSTGPGQGVGVRGQQIQNAVSIRTGRTGRHDVHRVRSRSPGHLADSGGGSLGQPRIDFPLAAHPPRWARTACGGGIGTWSPTDTPT